MIYWVRDWYSRLYDTAGSKEFRLTIISDRMVPIDLNHSIQVDAVKECGQGCECSIDLNVLVVDEPVVWIWGSKLSVLQNLKLLGKLEECD